MKATKQLIQEHDSVLIMLSILKNITDRLTKGGQVNPLHLEGIIVFLKVFVDQSHHGKEEKLLFPLLEKKGIANNGGPIGVMLSEHIQGRLFIKGFSDATDKYRKGNTNAISEIVKNANGYIELLQQHIFKENNILFKMADSHLTEIEDEILNRKFTELDETEIGKIKHDELYGILNELKHLYLPNN